MYRDLLSDNDKSLASQNQNQNGPRRNVIVYSESFGGDSEKPDRKVPKFKGLLSIGVDKTSNSLLVSAPAYLFDIVAQRIKDLDDAAAENNAIRVVKIGSGISAERMQQLLDDILHPGNSSNRTKSSKDHATTAPAAKQAAKSGSKSTTAGSSGSSGSQSTAK